MDLEGMEGVEVALFWINFLLYFLVIFIQPASVYIICNVCVCVCVSVPRGPAFLRRARSEHPAKLLITDFKSLLYNIQLKTKLFLLLLLLLLCHFCGESWLF